MDDNQLLRYSRHIVLPQIGYEGQSKINQTSVLVVGLGGIGSTCALYLASSGFNPIVLADSDKVELSNLQRQIIHNETTLGINKALSAQQQIKLLNSSSKAVVIDKALDKTNSYSIINEVDIVLDGSDNFPTRYLINQTCINLKKPLISIAAIGFDAQLSVFDFRIPNSACYACLFPNQEINDNRRCSEEGVLAPLVGVVASMGVCEAIKLTNKIEENLINKLWVYDALSNHSRILNIVKDPNCPACKLS